MTTDVFPVPGPWIGTLFLSSRPRGGDWLEDETAEWANRDIDTVVSLLTPEEEGELGLEAEASLVKSHEMNFISFPIEDRSIPDSDYLFDRLLERVEDALNAGKNVLVHCRQGVGRTGLVAAGILAKSGRMSPDAAFDLLSSVRGVAVPETVEQKAYISHTSVSVCKR